MRMTRWRIKMVSRQILSLPNCVPSYSGNVMCELYFSPFSSRLLLHRSLGLWIVYQRVLGFRLSYRTVVKLLYMYIAIHVIQNLYAWMYGWGTRLLGGHNLMWHRFWLNPLPEVVSMCIKEDYSGHGTTHSVLKWIGVGDALHVALRALIFLWRQLLLNFLSIFCIADGC